MLYAFRLLRLAPLSATGQKWFRLVEGRSGTTHVSFRVKVTDKKYCKGIAFAGGMCYNKKAKIRKGKGLKKWNSRA